MGTDVGVRVLMGNGADEGPGEGALEGAGEGAGEGAAVPLVMLTDVGVAVASVTLAHGPSPQPMIVKFHTVNGGLSSC